MPHRKTVFRCMIFAALCIADRVTKYAAQFCLPVAAGNESAAFFSLSLHHNKGISFGLLQNIPFAGLAVSILGVAILGFLCLKNVTPRSMFGVIFLWAGAVCNLTDRLLYGYVIDWLYVGLYVNLADVWLGVGCVMVLLHCASASEELRFGE